MPMLQAMTYYNFVQAVECAEFKAVFQPTPRSIAYVYERDGKTICYVMLREPAEPATLALKTAVPYSAQDIYGRTDRVTPNGASLVVATLDPLALLFDGEVPELYDPKSAIDMLAPVDGGIDLPVIARGASGIMKVNLPPIFAEPFTATAKATVDGQWPGTTPAQIAVQSDAAASAEIPITVAPDTAAGSYTFTTRIFDGDTLVTVLKQPLRISELLTMTMHGVPMTVTQDPVIAVTVKSLSDAPMSGVIRLRNHYFGTGFEPAEMEQSYAVGPGGTAEVRFPAPREQVNLASSYTIRATLNDESGFSVTTDDDVSFQTSVKTATPITVDGDLADWNLEELLPIPFERWHRGPRDPKEFSGRFYSRWDDEKLYFAAVIVDSVPVVTGTEKVAWNDDNIMFGLYPLQLAEGAGFRLSMTVWDQHQVEKKGWGQFSWLTFAGFNTSVNAQPNLWRQFTLVKQHQ